MTINTREKQAIGNTMKNNIPEVGDIITINPESIEEVEDYYLGRLPDFDWWASALSGLELQVNKIIKEKDYWLVTIATSSEYTREVVIDQDTGAPSNDVRSHSKPMFILYRNEANTNYCSCEEPELVKNSVFHEEFFYCRKCKKERQ